MLTKIQKLNRAFNVTRLILAVISLVSIATAQGGGKRPVSAQDSVLLREFNARNIFSDGGLFELSPDGSKLVYALREANLEKNRNEVVLYLRDITLNKGGQQTPLGRGREVFRCPAMPLGSKFQNTETSRSNQFRWLSDGQTLLVLGQPEGEPFPVVSRVDTRSGSKKVVYRPGFEVTEFSADRIGRQIAVVGRAPTDIPNPLMSPYGVLITGSNPDKRLDEEFSSARNHYEFRASVRDTVTGTEAILLRSQPVRPSVGGISMNHLQVSPDGRYLIFTTNVANVKIPSTWTADPLRAFRASKVLIFDLQDVRPGSKEQPEYRMAFQRPVLGDHLVWSDDSSSYLVVGPPPTEVRDKDGLYSASARQLYAVDARSGAATLVTSDLTTLYKIVAFDQGGRRAVVRFTQTPFSRARADINKQIISRNRLVTFGRSALSEWKEENSVKLNVAPFMRLSEDGGIGSSSAENGRIVIDVEQSPTTPPDIWATDIVTGERTRLTEINPELRKQKLPRIETIEFKGEYGDYWGYLIYPIDYVPGKRYPAVFMDKDWGGNFVHHAGAYLNEFPPLQLSASGMFVLLLTARPNVPVSVAETAGARYGLGGIDAYRSAKNDLTAKGLIDPNRVGLMSFSSSVLRMKYALSHPKQEGKPEWAAAIGIDGNIMSTLDFHQRLGHRDDVPWMYGGPPYGTSKEMWEKHSVEMNADKVRTPVISVYHKSVVRDEEWVTALSVQGKPIEMVWFPQAGHSKVAPQSRLAWINQTVDWMRFWLQDYEGTAPAHDPDRFVRWRKMRQQHRWNEQLIAEGKDPAQEYMNLRVAGKKPIFHDDGSPKSTATSSSVNRKQK